MAKRPFAGIAILFSLVALPVAAAAQTPLVAPSITVTATETASGPVSGSIAAVIVRGGGTDKVGLEAVLAKVGVSDFIDDHSFLSFLPSAVGVRGRMAATTHDAFAGIEAAVQDYVRAHRGASVVRVGFYGLAVDCPAIAERARAAALAEAQKKAAGLASAAGISLGGVMTVAEAKGCPPPGRLAGSYAMDPQTLAMRVPLQETVTYSVVRP